MLDIAILEGARTPFAKAFGVLADTPAQELGKYAAVAALERAEVKPDQIDQVVFGNVASPPEAANVSRVIALMSGIPQSKPAHTVHRNCASGMEAIASAAQLIRLNEAETVLAGGVESMSRIPLLYSEEATRRFLELARSKTMWQRLKALLKFRLRHFKPIPAIQLGLTDPVSGLMMGGTAEVLAADFDITREEQDRFALESHRRATEAQKRCVLSEEIVPVTAHGDVIKEDVGPRANQTLEALARLKPYFKEGGTVTVGNSCSITDGAVALVLMPGEKARAEGREPLGYIRAYASAGCEPERMGLGPVFATHKLLKQTGLGLKDIDLIELNEAFAAQVLACEKAFASDSFCQQHFSTGAIGELDRAILNVNGGAIALGHPVGATGARLVLTLLKEMKRRNLKRGLATLCVGGGQGEAMLLERNGS
ncbi:MAG: acetyl-CoA acetyltransferase [Gemmatales bacterium]|nr:MAG: acetyl-CoA acetyltransferase [Gemmatales bacterium]